MVSWVATASARIVESTARLRRPRRIPVSSTTCRTASLIRCGRVDFASRLRQYTNVDGSNPLWSNAIPVATFHRTSHRAAASVSPSERSCRVCNTRIEAITDAGIDGRPRPEGNKSSNSASANKSWRWGARNANMPPPATRRPTHAPAPATAPRIRRGQQETAAGVRHMQAQHKADAALDADRAAAALLAGIQGGVGVMLATGDLGYLEAALDVGIQSLRVTGQQA